MKIVFFGTSPFAARLLGDLLEQGDRIVAVVTRPDREKGRLLKLSPSAVKAKVLELSAPLPLYAPEKASTEAFAQVLKGHAPDLFLVVAYGEIIKQNLLNIPCFGSVNVHASLLPKYRGAAPMQRALMAGEEKSGVTLIEMALQMDVGPILYQEEVLIPQEMNCKELEESLYGASCIALKKVLHDYEKGCVQRVLQKEALATFAPKILPHELKIDWKKSAVSIHNLVRALSPERGAFATILLSGKEKRLIIRRTQVESRLEGKPGELLLFDKKRWVVACGEGAISLLEVQLEGKKVMLAPAFLQGFFAKRAGEREILLIP